MLKFSEFKNYQMDTLTKLFKDLKTNQRGLTEKEARKRIFVFGKNELSQKKKIHPVAQFLKYFRDPLVMILIIAALVSGFIGELKNAMIIIAIVFLSVAMKFYQEFKSGQAAEKLARKLAVTATVFRDGKRKEILVKYIVPGDVIALSAGDIIPADGCLIQADDFFVNESILTGESFPVEKIASASEASKVREVFSGTNVVSGSALFLAVRTGVNTSYGKIADKITRPEETGAFEIGIRNFGFLIIRLTIFIVLTIFLINAFLKHNYFESFVFSLAVAVGLTPELLPMILSMNMAKGSIKMAKKGVIVKRLNAIPDFGSMDILCTDKTGTLTENKITVVKYIDVFGQTSERVLRLAYLNGYFETGLKSLLEKAILDFKHIRVDRAKKIDEIPYDFLRKRLSVVVSENNHRLMITKGAPEEIFKICTYYSDGEKRKKLTADFIKKLVDIYENLSGQGFRVLAIAVKEVKQEKKVYTKSEESQMDFSGFIAFYDPPKASVKETLKFIKAHGIEIKILTGDSLLVTEKICGDIGLEISGVVLGEEIDQLSNQLLIRKAVKANIFARVTPEQKDRIVTLLRQQDLTIGYLGDGINDAPALKSANVGISVDNAADVAKETADIILQQKGLKELMDGIIEGRKTFGNTMKYLMMGLSSNFGNMFSLIGAALYLPFLPMLPYQILLNNFLYDFSQMTIPLDKVDREYLLKPKHWDINFIRDFMYVFGPLSSIFDLLTFYLLYSIFHLTAAMFQTGWFIESLATQALVIYIIRTKRVPFLRSLPSRYLVLSTVLVISAGLILTTTFLGEYFSFTPLPGRILLVIFCLVAIYLMLAEITKAIFYKKFSKIV